MAKKLFITGTGTDVGKTYIAGLIVKKMNEAGLSVAYYKAAMSGNERDNEGNLIPGDALFVKNISGIRQPLSDMCPYVYESAVSPHLASKIEGNPVEMEVVVNNFDRICREYDYVVMEGSGGILCPIRFDDEKIQLEDIVKRLNLSSVLVADAGLGTINSVVLTAEYMKSKNLPLKAVIFNNYVPGDVMQEDNIFMCGYMSDLPVAAKVKRNDVMPDIDMEKLKGLFE